MPSNSAEYMRSYRARKKTEAMAVELTQNTPLTLIGDEHLALLNRQIAELEEEVRHLKAELAKRPTAIEELVRVKSNSHQFNTRPFTPVPKK